MREGAGTYAILLRHFGSAEILCAGPGGALIGADADCALAFPGAGDVVRRPNPHEGFPTLAESLVFDSPNTTVLRDTNGEFSNHTEIALVIAT